MILILMLFVSWRAYEFISFLFSRSPKLFLVVSYPFRNFFENVFWLALGMSTSPFLLMDEDTKLAHLSLHGHPCFYVWVDI